MKRLLSRVLVLLLLGSAVASAFKVRMVAARDIYVPSDYSTIQKAINAASSGDRIYVSSGVYVEDVVVNKTISLVGINKETTCIHGNGGRIAVCVIADSAVVTGFTIKSSGGQYDDGIDLSNVRNCDVSENNVLSSIFGIGIFFCSNCAIHDNHAWKNQYGVGGACCSNCRVSENEVVDNENGIAIDMSSSIEMKGNNITGNEFGIVSDFPYSDNCIVDNSITNNTYGVRLNYEEDQSVAGNCITGNIITGNQYGVWQYSSFQTRITQNNIASNTCGIKLESSQEDRMISNNVTDNRGFGIWLSSSSNNSMTDNHVADNGCGMELEYSSDNTLAGNVFVNDGLSISESFSNTVEGNSVNGKPLIYLEEASDRNVGNAGQVILVSCNMIQVANLELTHTFAGLQMWATNNAVVTGNNMSDNIFGIISHHSSNNTIIANIIAKNQCGISFAQSSNNTIYNNNFMNNTNQVVIDTSANAWNNDCLTGGNHWSDYTGVDEESGPNQNQMGNDGIGDTPYTIGTNNQDSYPLMHPWPCFIFQSNMGGGGRMPCID